MITSFWKTLSSLKCVHSCVKLKVESWWLKQILVIKDIIYYYSGKIRVGQLIYVYIYIFLPAAAFATNEMESDMDKGRRGRFLKNFFLDYIRKSRNLFFF